jgi:hypothetical protein
VVVAAVVGVVVVAVAAVAVAGNPALRHGSDRGSAA